MVGRRALLAASALLAAAPVRAQQRPLRIITPFAPGGATDALARLVGLRITALTDQTVVVEPKPGAGGGTGRPNARPRQRFLPGAQPAAASRHPL